jgi:hypothetical protein
MKRPLFNLAAAASLVVCLGLSALWALSYWRTDLASVVTIGCELVLQSRRGLLAVGVHHRSDDDTFWYTLPFDITEISQPPVGLSSTSAVCRGLDRRADSPQCCGV